MERANAEMPPFPEVTQPGRRPHRVLLLGAGLGPPRDAVRDVGRRARVDRRVRRALPRGRRRRRRSGCSTTSSGRSRRCRRADLVSLHRPTDRPAGRSRASERHVRCFDRHRTRVRVSAANLWGALCRRCGRAPVGALRMRCGRVPVGALRMRCGRVPVGALRMRVAGYLWARCADAVAEHLRAPCAARLAGQRRRALSRRCVRYL